LRAALREGPAPSLEEFARQDALLTSVKASAGSAAVAPSLEGTVVMSRRTPWGGYYGPVVTVVLVAVPLYMFRNEESLLHVIFRVAWSVLLILSLVEIGRNLHRDLRGRREGP
jgi:hypothetical protein